MTFDFAALERRIAALEANRGASLRFGTVTEVNPDAGSARVQLDDGQGLVSWPLRVLQPRSLKDKRQMMPDIGEPVAVLFAGQGFEQGVILGAHYSTRTPSPNQPAAHDYVQYEDGTELWYDRKGHKLVAKVKGDADIETDGTITARAQKEVLAESGINITLRAPTITLAGLLRVTDKNGRPGSGELLGTYQVRQGNLHVPEGNVTAGAVSLRQHIHGGVESGPSTTAEPVGGGMDGTQTGPESDAFWENLFDLVSGLLPDKLPEMDELLLCLPHIAEAEGQRVSGADRQGWLYLRTMFHRWFSGVGSTDSFTNTVQDGAPLWVDWGWVMSYERVQREYGAFINPETPVSQIMNRAAQKKLGDILAREGFLRTERTEFNFCSLNWSAWEDFYHTLRPVQSENIKDGLQAALAGFTLRALASGYTEPNKDGTHTINVMCICVFAHDIFNFAEGEDSSGNMLFYWNCKEKFFSPSPFSGGTRIMNSDFNIFRQRYNQGRDFLVLSRPHPVENFHGVRYVYP